MTAKKLIDQDASGPSVYTPSVITKPCEPHSHLYLAPRYHDCITLGVNRSFKPISLHYYINKQTESHRLRQNTAAFPPSSRIPFICLSVWVLFSRRVALACLKEVTYNINEPVHRAFPPFCDPRPARRDREHLVSPATLSSFRNKLFICWL